MTVAQSSLFARLPTCEAWLVWMCMGSVSLAPMTLSMTGFARAEADTEYGALAWEVRTVNHRHLELSLRMPEECRVLEPRVRDAVDALFARADEFALNH
jgi:hypothetical protein